MAFTHVPSAPSYEEVFHDSKDWVDIASKMEQELQETTASCERFKKELSDYDKRFSTLRNSYQRLKNDYDRLQRCNERMKAKLNYFVEERKRKEKEKVEEQRKEKSMFGGGRACQSKR